MTHMFYRTLLAPLGLLALIGLVVAQAPKADEKKASVVDNDLDAVSKQAAVLEAELAKTSNTSKAAGETMLKLVNVYHDGGRPFGLVRVGQSFVGLHTAHPAHRDVMLKLIDGLQATGRNKELIGTGRQFLSRYPNDPACAEVERWLSRLLRRANDAPGAAAVLEAHWKRLGTTDDGPKAARDAINIYMGINTPDSLNKAGALGEDMLDKLPAGGMATAAGWTAFDAYERLSAWAKANIVAGKLLAKSPPTIPSYVQSAHARMAENFSRQGQRVNAIESWKKAIAVANMPTRPDLYSRLVEETFQTQPKVADFEALINDYAKQFPDRADRHMMRTRLAQLLLANKDNARAEQVLADVLPFDARSHGASSLYVQQFGNEPDMATRDARLKKAEETLKAALAKSSPANAAPLRYSLALELYRDRMKDNAKAKAITRELAFQFPVNDGLTGNALAWLLESAADDAEFNADLTKAMEARLKHPWMPIYRNTLNNWATAKIAAKAKENSKRPGLVRAEVARTDKEPAVVLWLNYETLYGQNVWSNQTAAAREKLMTPELLAAYPDELANSLLYEQQYYFRNQAPVLARDRAVDVAKTWVARLPKSGDAAWAYITSATDLAKADASRDAVDVYLKREPTSLNTDLIRRMAGVANGAKDIELGKQSWAWAKKMFDKFGYDNSAMAGIGDSLSAVGLKAEARECWEKALTGNVDSGDYRESAFRLLALLPEPADKMKLLDTLLAKDSGAAFSFAVAKADLLLKSGDMDGAAKLLNLAAKKVNERPFHGQSIDSDFNTLVNWVSAWRIDMKASEADKRKLFSLVRDLGIFRASMIAQTSLLELGDELKLPPMQRLLLYTAATRMGGTDSTDFDMLSPFVLAANARKDYIGSSTLISNMLANLPTIDEPRRKSGRDMLTQAYARLGASGGAVIDENSPIAPLLAAALQLRLGDQKLAFETYLANQKLFDAHRAEVPVDLLAFVCDNHMAAGGDENHNRVEDILRSWLIKNADAKDFDEVEKARIQLLLARNFFKAKRYDLARAEYTTLLNRYSKTPQAVEADFGIGETFMEQKVYDQAEAAFERLAGSREREVVIRAEFLRGVLANRRGDRDEARAIFRSVLERVPNLELANQALFQLSEVYGAEQRFVDQLELLRTIGRLGRTSKRFHTPGEPLSIVVQDSDLGVSRGHNRIPVRVITEPGGDEETIYLISGGAGKGLFRADLETRLGTATKGDRLLQLTGKDVIRVDYPPEFKKEFKDTPLPDTEIRIAADGKLEISSSKIIDEDEESFSKALENEANPEIEDQRKGIARPKNQVKPGNLVYLRVKDADRDLTDQKDKFVVRLASTSGDQVSITLTETGAHTGIFEGTGKTGDLPAGALATNTAIDHSPLMAIDKDKKTAWISEPDGATPKFLTIDMKNLKRADQVVVFTPDPLRNAPIRMTIEGSDDGRLWYRLATSQPEPKAAPTGAEFGPMNARIYEVPNNVAFTTWDQVVNLAKTGTPSIEGKAADLFWTRQPDEKPKRQTAIIWQGKVVQPKAGATRIALTGDVTALWIDGRLELPMGKNGRYADVYLEAGTHDMIIFASATVASNTLEAKWAVGDTVSTTVEPVPFREADFDLARPEAKLAGTPRPLGECTADKDGTSWDFRFAPASIRHVRVLIHEYRGEAVAINQVDIRDNEKNVTHIPTDADLLSLSTNDTLELGGGDEVTATYIDEANQTGSSRLLTAKLTATYHNAIIHPIGYDFVKSPNGQVGNIRKQLLRIDPGERIIIEVTDFDMDATAGPDKVKVAIAVNDGPLMELEATETQPNSGTFTKEIDTGMGEGKLTVKPGDLVRLVYIDHQNTVPGHAAPRETVVYVNEPTDGRVRVIESRMFRAKNAAAVPQIRYLPPSATDADAKKIAGVTFEAPFSIEVIDRDAAKDSRSKVIVQLKTTGGSTVEVECVLTDRRLGTTTNDKPGTALKEGRFTGQVIMQLGNKDSLAVVPLTATMPRDVIGGPKLPDEEGEQPKSRDRAIVTGVLNLTGSDIVEVTYKDERRTVGAAELKAGARLLTDGKLYATDAEYLKDMTAVHVGERLFLRVVDADLDRTPDRDKAKVRIRTKRGEDETIELEETLNHSGIFTGSILLKPEEKPTAGNLKPELPELECFFGDAIETLYIDERASSTDGKFESTVNVAVIIGTDGKVQAFSKAFANERLAVETQFTIAESHFKLFQSHQSLGRDAEAKADLESGRRVLREVIEDYPNPKYVPRISYLLGQFAQELKQYPEAIQAYQTIVKQFPDHELAADAQFKLAQCYEESNEFNQALEAYVTLAATYPNSPLIEDVMIRISEHFYKIENFKVAAQVGERFQEKFPSSPRCAKMAFRVGQCYYKDKQYPKAAVAFEGFGKKFVDDALHVEALFWAGESYRTAGNMQKAFENYNYCRWKFPATETAKYARGRLALPEMLRQFEAASNLEK